jgi:hypothetical protein
MGDLLGFVRSPRQRALRLAAALVVIWGGLVSVPSAQAADAVLLAAGDISDCSNAGDSATAALLGIAGATVVTLGDNVYPVAAPDAFNACYGPTWGRFKNRTRPAPGNHDYGPAGARPYFDYFGSTAGPRGTGWYSYDAGAWHVVVLNSNCGIVECGPGSAQESWLRADLAAHSSDCTLAYWHHPRFTSGWAHSDAEAVGAFWEALYDEGADLVLSAHAHVYERFAAQNPSGGADPDFGIREIVVGTGGESHHGFATAKPNSEVRNAAAFGVLKLTLHGGSYDWSFLPQAGKTFSDAGTADCHGRPPSPPTTTTSSSSTSTSSTSSSTSSTSSSTSSTSSSSTTTSTMTTDPTAGTTSSTAGSTSTTTRSTGATTSTTGTTIGTTSSSATTTTSSAS